MYDIPTRKKWDSNIKDFSIVKQLSKNIVYYYMSLKVPFPFEDRDFIEKRTITYNKKNKEHIVIYRQAPNEVIN